MRHTQKCAGDLASTYKPSAFPSQKLPAPTALVVSCIDAVKIRNLFIRSPYDFGVITKVRLVARLQLSKIQYES